MGRRSTIRRLLAFVRIAVGNLCLLAILLASGPVMGSESTEAPTTPVESKESCTEAVICLETRLVRIRLLWTSPSLLSINALYSALPRQQAVPLTGHRLSHELLAPLRC